MGTSPKAGLLLVDPVHQSQMFYWYFPAPKKAAPLILWVQGGPGSSGLIGLLKEFGPIQLSSEGHLVPRNESWNQEFGLLFVDSPVGTGYSYTTEEAGYA